jgi:hypothetical protein
VTRKLSVFFVRFHCAASSLTVLHLLKQKPDNAVAEINGLMLRLTNQLAPLDRALLRDRYFGGFGRALGGAGICAYS